MVEGMGLSLPDAEALVASMTWRSIVKEGSQAKKYQAILAGGPARRTQESLPEVILTVSLSDDRPGKVALVFRDWSVLVYGSSVDPSKVQLLEEFAPSPAQLQFISQAVRENRQRITFDELEAVAPQPIPAE